MPEVQHKLYICRPLICPRLYIGSWAKNFIAEVVLLHIINQVSIFRFVGDMSVSNLYLFNAAIQMKSRNKSGTGIKKHNRVN